MRSIAKWRNLLKKQISRLAPLLSCESKKGSSLEMTSYGVFYKAQSHHNQTYLTLLQISQGDYFSCADVYVILAKMLFEQASCFMARTVTEPYVSHVPLFED